MIAKEEAAKREISEKKKEEIDVLRESLVTHNTVLITSLSEMPADLVQKIRMSIKEKVVMRIAKIRVIVKLFEQEAEKDSKFAKLAEFCRDLKESCAVVFSNEDVFKLVKLIQEKETKKRAKAGIAKEDIVVEAGNTGMMPGPVLTALSDAGIKAGLERGKIAIKQKFEVKAGEKISEALAIALEKLEVFPITAKFAPLVAYDKEADIMFKADSLEINVEQRLVEMRQAYTEAFSLMLEMKYLTPETVPIFITEAFHGAKHLTMEAEIVNKDSVRDLLIMAGNQASMINKKI